jgi:aldehyde:ferredoxin oxidoreductase
VIPVNGYAGKVLRVNLTLEKSQAEVLNPKLVEQFVGGRGLAAMLLSTEIAPGIDPLSPENKLIIMTGPLTGTIIPSAPKFVITTKSPLTKIYGFAMVSGFFAQTLKAAGYDGIIIEGVAKEPKYLWINDGKAELKRAEHIWGLTTSDSQCLLKDEIGVDAEIAVIGPAGERLVPIASVIVGKRAGGRCGVGAVFGSKRLKAIAVHGSEEVTVNNPEKLREIAGEMIKALREKSPTKDNYPKYGTTFFVGTTNHLGVFPACNFLCSGTYDNASKIDEMRFREHVVRDSACPRCPVVCEKITAVKEGPYAPTFVQGPQYETIWALGAQCGVDRFDAIIAANRLCNDLGLDTISAGNAIGFAMECYEKGLLKSQDLELRFGRHEVLLPLIRQMTYGEGIGKILAGGVRSAAEQIGHGAENFAMHVKGLELPAYDPRAIPGMGLAFATASRGGCHLRAWTITDELIGSYKLYSIEGRAELVSRIQNIRAFIDSSGMCIFPMRAISFDLLVEAVSAVTGFDYKGGNAVKVGERIYNLERILHIREGISRKDDILPKRFFDETLPTGPHKGQKLSRDSFEKMKDEYYTIRGWKLDNGAPTNTRLKELGLETTSYGTKA